MQPWGRWRISIKKSHKVLFYEKILCWNSLHTTQKLPFQCRFFEQQSVFYYWHFWHSNSGKLFTEKLFRHLAGITLKNKNALTGRANCKKTTRHHAHLSLCAKSRKTNNAKSRKWPKTSIREYLQIKNFFQKSGSVIFPPL